MFSNVKLEDDFFSFYVSWVCIENNVICGICLDIYDIL